MVRLTLKNWRFISLIPSVLHTQATGAESQVGKTLEESHFISKGAIDQATAGSQAMDLPALNV